MQKPVQVVKNIDAIQKKYGKIPQKNPEITPWEHLCVDLILPYSIKFKRKELNLKAITLIDPATSWFEILQFEDKQAKNIVELVNQVWLSRYPRPQLMTYDNGTEFIGRDFRITMAHTFGIKARPTTIKIHKQMLYMKEFTRSQPI